MIRPTDRILLHMTPIEYFNRKITFTNIVYDTRGCTPAMISEAYLEGDFLDTISIPTGDFLEDYGDMDLRAQWSGEHQDEHQHEEGYEEDDSNVPMHIELEFLEDDIYVRGADFISDHTGWLVTSFDCTIGEKKFEKVLGFEGFICRL